MTELEVLPETQPALHKLKDKLANKTAHIVVVGLGYVGLPLAVRFAEVGFHVTGLEVSEDKVRLITAGKNYIPDVESAVLARLVTENRLMATTDPEVLETADAIVICVPTPLSKSQAPDVSYIMAAAEKIAEHIHPEMLVVLESTTYPGTTEEMLLPMLSKDGFTVGVNFALCFSPERIDPGNKTYGVKNTPKVVGGITPVCGECGVLLYSDAIDTVVPVSNTRVAETVKLMENSFRLINISFANEMAIICDRMGINIWEVIDAAKTKPFGYMPFYPGCGIGGHCIGIDPFYLSWKSKQYGCDPRFIELAGVINQQMPHYVVQKVQDALNRHGKAVQGAHIHICGIAYKKDVDDVRESPAVDIAHLLLDMGAHITYYDPFIPELKVNGMVLKSGVNLDGTTYPEALFGNANDADCVVITTDHSGIDYKAVLEWSKLVVDTRNALKGINSPKIVRL